MPLPLPAIHYSRAALLRYAVSLLLAGALALVAAGRAAADSGYGYSQSAAAFTLPDGTQSNTPQFLETACDSTNVCVGVGTFANSSGNEAMVASIVNGVPGPVVEVTLPLDARSSSQDALLEGVSCQDDGSCTAYGTYLDGSGDTLPMVVEISGGAPSAAVQVGGPADESAPDSVSLNGLACPATGACAAVGSYFSEDANGTVPLVVAVSDGVPQEAQAVSLPGDAGTPDSGALQAVACASAGGCVAVGTYNATAGSLPLAVPINDGTAGTATEGTLPADYAGAPYSDLPFISCPASGFCEALGDYTDSNGQAESFVAPVNGGAIGNPTEITLPADYDGSGGLSATGLGCSTPTLCVATGFYSTSNGGTAGSQAVAIIISGPQAVAHEATLPPDADSAGYAAFTNNDGEFGESVGCMPSGPCLAGGYYSTSATAGEGMVEQTAADGTLGPTEETPAPSDINTISNPLGSGPSAGLTGIGCDAYGSCAATGIYYNATDQNVPYLVDEQAPLAVSTTSLPGGTQGAAYPATTLAATGAWGVYSWSVSSGSLPAGLSLNPQTGVISGTPTGSGTSTFTVQVTGTGTPVPTATQQLSLTVTAAPAQTTTAPVPVPATVAVLATSGRVSANRVHAKLSCSGAACSGTVKLEATRVVMVKRGKRKVRRRRTVVIASGRYSLAAGAVRTLALTLNGSGRKLLAASRSHRLRVTVAATLTGGHGASRRETLYSAAKKRKKKTG